MLDTEELKDGKVKQEALTFDQPTQTVQVVAMFYSQLLFGRLLLLKMEERNLPKDFFLP